MRYDVGMTYEDNALGEVLRFWFEELTMEDWFSGDRNLDATITERFADLHTRVAAGEFWKHRTTPQSYLAEVIVLDQFSRNMYRDTPQAFAYDGQALTLAQHATAANFDNQLSESERMFLYMPFMHSESAVIHTEALKLFEALGNKEALKYEKIHKDIIDRFGRYPHRNETLGRESTPEEADYLEHNHEDFF